MSKYNFNPTPEQLADPKFWASDEVPDGADGFYPEDDDFVSRYLKFENGEHFSFSSIIDSKWQDTVVFEEELEKIIARPTDPNALKQLTIGSVWVHTNGNEYTVIALANTETNNADKYPVTVVYQNVKNGTIWSRPLSDWHRSMILAKGVGYVW